MSLTYGFYNSLNGDRKYDAIQISSIFDGIIKDGIFASIGDALVVTANEGLIINVGTGRAWFNRTWTYNDSTLPLIAPDSEMLLDRIDAVVLEVNTEDAVRSNTIKFVTGLPSSTPQRPTLINSERVHQYPLCYIYRAAESTEIRQSDITNMIGTDDTPFITGILETVSMDALLGQWRGDLDDFVEDQEAAFEAWFATLQDVLDENTAGNLLNLINQKENKSVFHNLVLSENLWTPNNDFFQYELSVPGVLPNNGTIQQLSLRTEHTRSQYDAFNSAGLADGGQVSNKITIFAYGDKPVIDIPITVEVKIL